MPPARVAARSRDRHHRVGRLHQQALRGGGRALGHALILATPPTIPASAAVLAKILSRFTERSRTANPAGSSRAELDSPTMSG